MNSLKMRIMLEIGVMEASLTYDLDPIDIITEEEYQEMWNKQFQETVWP